MGLRQLRMIRGPVFKFGRHALGDGGWEESIDKLVGQTGDKTSWPKQRALNDQFSQQVQDLYGEGTDFAGLWDRAPSDGIDHAMNREAPVLVGESSPRKV